MKTTKKTYGEMQTFIHEGYYTMKQVKGILEHMEHQKATMNKLAEKSLEKIKCPLK